MERTLLYWPEAADDPALADVLDEVEFEEVPGSEDPEGDEGSDGDEGEEWAPEVPAEVARGTELDRLAPASMA